MREGEGGRRRGVLWLGARGARAPRAYSGWAHKEHEHRRRRSGAAPSATPCHQIRGPVAAAEATHKAAGGGDLAVVMKPTSSMPSKTKTSSRAHGLGRSVVGAGGGDWEEGLE
jgi:hypothetical protein